jgi:aryl-alcohol dehydrogenase-like predicted oxidoreductase
MELRMLGTSNIKISPIVMGTWQAGKDMWVGIDDTESTQAIKAAYDAGITTFDTAEVYGNGHSEKIVGNALCDVRARVVIATKVFSNHLQYKQVIDACHGSLKNLNTDYIDLYQIHWPPGSFGGKKVPLEETMRAMTDLKEQGKIRAIGVSNFSRSQLEDAATYGRIDSLQPPYSLFWRKVETDAMPYCRENNITLLAYSSMAQGLYSARITHLPKVTTASKINCFSRKIMSGSRRHWKDSVPLRRRIMSLWGNWPWPGSFPSPERVPSPVPVIPNRPFKMPRLEMFACPKKIWRPSMTSEKWSPTRWMMIR